MAYAGDIQFALKNLDADVIGDINAVRDDLLNTWIHRFS